MNTPPRQPEKEPDEQEVLLTSEERRRQLIQVIGVMPLAETISWGERVLPLLFASMETCWVDAILIGLASMGLFGSHDPLVPLWAPFLYIAGSQWLYTYLERRAATSPEEGGDTGGLHPGERGAFPGGHKAFPGDPKIPFPGEGGVLPGGRKGRHYILVFVVPLVVLTLLVIWLHLYTRTAFLLDPRWLLALLNDILLVHLQFYQVLTIVGLALYFCWRGIRIVQRVIEPSQAFNGLRLGMGIIIAVIIVRAGQPGIGLAFNDELILLFLIPLFLYLSLSAHALARITFIRHNHPVGLQGDIAVQERAILMTIGGIGLFLLFVALLVGSAASSALLDSVLQGVRTLFAALGAFYTWLVPILALIVTILALPFFWLLTLYTFLSPPRNGGAPSFHVTNGQIKTTAVSPDALVRAMPIVQVVLPILMVLCLGFLLWLALRRRRRMRIEAEKRNGEVRESLWSWQLFWLQLKTFLLALLRRFFPRRAVPAEEHVFVEDMAAEPAALSIREIYRALLKWAGNRGYARRRDETPYEFQQRLDEHLPFAEPQLSTVTEAYTATRYGEIVHDEAEVARIRKVWAELQQKVT